jgi:DNA-binding MarR family transcriptional regulator
MENTEIEMLMNTLSQIFKLAHQQSYQKMDQLNMYPGQPKLLALLLCHEGLTQKELACKNFVKPSTITGMLNKLEANGYVYRIPDETDKRSIRVYLTSEGRQLAAQGQIFLHQLTEQMFAGFTEEELKAYIRLSDKIKRNLQNNTMDQTPLQ